MKSLSQQCYVQPSKIKTPLGKNSITAIELLNLADLREFRHFSEFVTQSQPSFILEIIHTQK